MLLYMHLWTCVVFGILFYNTLLNFIGKVWVHMYTVYTRLLATPFRTLRSVFQFVQHIKKKVCSNYPCLVCVSYRQVRIRRMLVYHITCIPFLI